MEQHVEPRNRARHLVAHVQHEPNLPKLVGMLEATASSRTQVDPSDLILPRVRRVARDEVDDATNVPCLENEEVQTTERSEHTESAGYWRTR